jgi:hypothetical protein
MKYEQIQGGQMTKTLVNLAVPVIIQIIEEILENHPCRYRNAFSIPDLRQELIAYILNHLPGDYIVFESLETKEVTENSYRYYSKEHRNLIKIYALTGIQTIFQSKRSEISVQIPLEGSKAYHLSHWFG